MIKKVKTTMQGDMVYVCYVGGGKQMKKQYNIYCDKKYQCMMSTQELIRIHNDSGHQQLVEIYNRWTKVGKVY